MKDTPILDTSLPDDLLSHRGDLKREATFVDAAIAAERASLTFQKYGVKVGSIVRSGSKLYRVAEVDSHWFPPRPVARRQPPAEGRHLRERRPQPFRRLGACRMTRTCTLGGSMAEFNWQPIETAPRDNKRPLLLASFDDRGVLSNVDFNGSWECESESWELPQEYYFWNSENGMADEPTHWAYQPEGFAKLGGSR